MILHEMCHALVEGEDAWRRADWGLDNQTSSMIEASAERACLRPKAALATPHGLRRMLAATTDHRPFYMELPADPFTGDTDDVILARLGWRRSRGAPFAPHLEHALAATAEIARTAARFATPNALFSVLDEPLTRHPLGFPLRAPTGETCGTCAWRHGEKAARCRQAGDQRVESDWPACERAGSRPSTARTAAPAVARPTTPSRSAPRSAW